MRERRKIVLFVHIDDSGCINVEIDEVCATDDDRSEQETIVSLTSYLFVFSICTCGLCSNMVSCAADF